MASLTANPSSGGQWQAIKPRQTIKSWSRADAVAGSHRPGGCSLSRDGRRAAGRTLKRPDGRVPSRRLHPHDGIATPELLFRHFIRTRIKKLNAARPRKCALA
jgi:hypothetical protein